MSTLAERIAAKRAAQAQETSKEEQPDGTVTEVDPEDKGIAVVKASAVLENLIKEEPVIKTEQKQLTFSEKMALKKAQEQAASSPEKHVTVAEVAASLTKPTIPSPLKEKIHDKIVSVLKDAQEQDDLEREEYKNAAPEIQQGYRDIKGRVEELSDTDDDDLADAMSQLKKSLLDNPSACLLMLDEDIGKMTIALRRLTQEALVAATKEKAPKGVGKKTKSTSQVALTEEQMQKVLDEL